MRWVALEVAEIPLPLDHDVLVCSAHDTFCIFCNFIAAAVASNTDNSLHLEAILFDITKVHLEEFLRN